MDKVQVLIVEDEAIVSMDLRFKLEAMGYGVPAETSSGKEAVDAVSKELSRNNLFFTTCSAILNG